MRKMGVCRKTVRMGSQLGQEALGRKAWPTRLNRGLNAGDRILNQSGRNSELPELLGVQGSATYYSDVKVKALFQKGIRMGGQHAVAGALKKVTGSLFRAIVLKNRVLN